MTTHSTSRHSSASWLQVRRIARVERGARVRDPHRALDLTSPSAGDRHGRVDQAGAERVGVARAVDPVAGQRLHDLGPGRVVMGRTLRDTACRGARFLRCRRRSRGRRSSAAYVRMAVLGGGLPCVTEAWTSAAMASASRSIANSRRSFSRCANVTPSGIARDANVNAVIVKYATTSRRVMRSARAGSRRRARSRSISGRRASSGAKRCGRRGSWSVPTSARPRPPR